jgi:hypothetical protein
MECFLEFICRVRDLSCSDKGSYLARDSANPSVVDVCEFNPNLFSCWSRRARKYDHDAVGQSRIAKTINEPLSDARLYSLFTFGGGEEAAGPIDIRLGGQADSEEQAGVARRSGIEAPISETSLIG